MQYLATTTAPATLETDCIVVAVFEDGELSPSASTLNKQSDDNISRIIARGDITGKAGQTLLLQDVKGITSPRVLLVGCGEKGSTSENNYISATTAMATVLNSTAIRHATSCLAEIDVQSRPLTWKVRQTAISTEAVLYKYTQTKSDIKPQEFPLESISFYDESDATQAALSGQAISNGMTLARELGNLPGNICTPTYLAQQAVELANRFDSISTTILDEDEMANLGMGSLLSVSRGSREPAKLIVMNYNGAADARPVVLVGKGLTFDAGGISLKPSSGMDEMKYDMCGAASVFGTLAAIAELKLAINVIGVVPSSENMPDGDANKPGDVVTSMAGKTIEILNTDAEGRLILCDALTYSARFDPEVVIDIATLTGAIIVALGSQASGLMANNQPLADQLLQAGNDSYDRVWQLPIWDDYQQQLDSNFADIANIGGKEAGSVTAACFLSRFTKDFNWAHLDIAGTAWKGGKAKGATGRPVPLLVQFLLNHIASK
ncbi:MAG: leucyl aminopeptidase [Methylophaga sp.]|nr:MAG: leucyl aminopeptidase [Methylophaga sp.]